MQESREIEKILRETEPVDSSTAQVLLMMAYDVTHDINDHRQDPNPLSAVAMHDAEKYYEWSSLYKAIERYHQQDIGHRFHLSLTEYLDLPRDTIEMITDIVMGQIQMENRAEENAETEAKKKLQQDQETLWGSGKKS